MKIDLKKVGSYWDRRLLSTDPLSAVLTFDAPFCLNEAYDKWERYSLFSSIKTSLKNKKVLDVGAGFGRISLEFAQQGALVSAVDISQNMLKMLTKNAKSMGLNSNIRVISDSTDNFNLNIKYDIILCLGLFEHLPYQSRNKTIQNCFNHLKRLGQFYTVINNSNNPFLLEKYRKQKRIYSGYQTSLVGLNWLQRVCVENNAQYEIVASNPNYAILHYFLNRRKLDSNLLIQMSRNALRADMLNKPYDNMARIFASHFIAKIKFGR